MQVDWSKYPLSQKDWEHFASLDRVGRRKFLKEHNLQYQRGEVPKCDLCSHAFFNCVCGNAEYQKKLEATRIELAKPFEEKLKHSLEVVERVRKIATSYNKKIYIGYSGGFDSECCLQLFKQLIKEGLVTVIVGDTLTDLPETRARWHEAEQELGVKFIYARPPLGVSFRTNSIKYGLALYPRNPSKSKGISVAMSLPTKRCCGNLKEKPQAKRMKDAYGIILGLRITEKTQGRKLTIYKSGDCFLSPDKKLWHVRPIAFWTKEDEWAFQKKMGFKYNAIYDKTDCKEKGFFELSNGKLFEIRSGCMFCPQTIHSGYLEWLQKYYPTQYDGLKKVYNNVAQARGDGMNFLQVLILKKKLDLKQKNFVPCGEPL